MKLRNVADIARYAMYDAGNSNYDTLVIALAFPVFLQTVALDDPNKTDMVWGIVYAAATLLTMLLGPKAGAYADRRGLKFAMLRGLSLAAIACTFMLAFLPAGGVLLTGALFVLMQCCFLLASLFYNSALADVSSKDDAAMVSSISWGVGYLGGLVGLALALACKGVTPEPRRLRAFFILASVLFLAFSLPLILRRDPKRPKQTDEEAPSLSLFAIIGSFMSGASRSRLFWAFFLYTNGVNTVIIFTSLFAKQTLGFDMNGLIGLFILMNLVAAPSAILFGKLAERIGQIRTLKIVVAAWTVAVGVIALVGHWGNQTAFTVAAACAASLIGPVQALSRSLFRIIFPENAMSSYFGVQAMANRCAALVGPLLFGVVSWLTGSQVLGALSAGLLFALGLLLLFTVPHEVEEL